MKPLQSILFASAALCTLQVSCSKSESIDATPLSPFDMAAQLHEAGDVEKAMEQYDRILMDDPKHADARLNRSLAKVELGLFTDALADVDQVLIAAPNDLDALVHRSQIYLAESRPVEALADLNAAAELDPTDARTYETRGDCWVELGENEAALEDYSNAIRLSPDDPELYASRATVYRAMGRLDEEAVDQILSDLTQQVLATEDDPDPLTRRAEAFLQVNEAELALQDCETILAALPQHDDAMLLRGHCHWLLGQQEEALADYNACITAKPNASPRALGARATIYSSLGEEAQAIDDLRTAVGQDPTDDELKADLAWLLSTAKIQTLIDGQEALDIAQQITPGGEEPWRAFEVQAAAHAALQNWTEANSAIDQAIKLAPKNLRRIFHERKQAFRL